MSIIGELFGINTAEQAWVDHAVCAQIDPDRWFPDKGGPVLDAKTVCQGCPVANECLQYALDHDERFGIWGGFTARERRKLQNGHPVKQFERRINCNNGHLLAAVGVDDRGRCRQCARDSVNRSQQRRRQRLREQDMPHDRNRYNLGCRCQQCKTANTAYIREYNNGRRKRGVA